MAGDCVELPLLGVPLAGKTTILTLAALAFGSRLERRIYEVQGPGPFRGASTAIVSVSLSLGARDVLMWCMPGGCGVDWPLPLLRPSSPALFAVDSQFEVQHRQREWWRVQADRVDVAGSLAIVTKADIPGSLDSAETLPPALHGRPHVRVAGLTCSGQDQIQAFLTSEIPSLLPHLVSGPVAEIEVTATWTPSRPR